MSKPCVLCIGEILFDDLADQLGRAVKDVESWTSYPGGAPANVACALTKLGTSSGFIGCVGQDVAGEELLSLLGTVGVNLTGVQRSVVPTRRVYVTRTVTGDRVFAGFRGRTTEFADTRLQAALLPIELFEAADFLVLGTLELAYPDSRAAIERALTLAKQHDVKILLDVNWRPVFWLQQELALPIIQSTVKQVDFVKLSEEEADWLFNTIDPKVIACQLDRAEGVLVTRGEQGCAYYLGGNEGELPGFSVAVVDTTGAGDSFVAGFLHQLNCVGTHLTEPETANRVVRYANAVGALTTTKPGAIASQPTRAEVEAFLSLQL